MARQMRKRMDHTAHFAGRFGAIILSRFAASGADRINFVNEETAAASCQS